MDKKALLESIYNILDVGILVEMLRNSLKMKLEMDMKEFFLHLIFGKGYESLTPIELEKMIAGEKDLTIIDLRGKKAFKTSHIKGAVLHPFDDFLRGILIDGQYREYQNRPMVLVCHTGHQSRAAASILAEAGFEMVFSARHGMRRFRRWQHLKTVLDRIMKNKTCRFCHQLAGLTLKVMR